MKKHFPPAWRVAAALLLAFQPGQAGAAPAVTETDICVYGGSAAGVMAAVQTARMGKRVALVEAGQHLGGASVEGLGGTDIDNHADFQNSPAVGGLAREFYRRVSIRYGRVGQFDQMIATGAKNASLWGFESKVAEQVMDELAKAAGVRIFRGHRLREVGGVTRDEATKRISAIRCENGATFLAGVFIDATIEGDLLAFAGVSTVIGREANATYGETKNGIRGSNTYRQFAVPVDPYRTPGNPASGLIATIQDEPLGTPGAGDQRIQAYCFRMCLTQNAANRIPFEKPANYDPAEYEIYRRYVAAGGSLWTPISTLPNGKTDLGSWHDLSANLYGMNHAYPGGSYAVRAQIYQQHLTFTQGLCWFLANDPALPASLRNAWSQWGVTRDEFTDNGGWPRQFYVRDGRRMVSDYVITEAHTRKVNQTAVSDSVAVAFWPPDTHHVRRIVRDGKAYNEGFVFGGEDWAPFGLSYRALVPRTTECTNLLTPTCLSSSHVAYGAIRLEWTFMALGQAAGTAAAFALDARTDVQALDYARLAGQLRADGQVLALAAATAEEIIVDNPAAVLTGAWTVSTNVGGYHGADYLTDGNTGQGTKTAIYTPTLPSAGSYDVYLRWTASANRATNAPVDVIHTAGTATVSVNQTQNHGAWVKLGRWTFAAGTAGRLVIRTSNVDGYVIADAARWVRVTSSTAQVEVLASDAVAREFSANGEDAARFTMVRDGDLSTALSVRYGLSGSVTSGADFEPLPGTASFAAGAATTSVFVRARADDLAEGDETLTLTLQSGAGYALGSLSQATLRVLDHPRDAWQAAHFTAAQLTDPAFSGPAGNPDGDDADNALEYLQGRDPRDAEAAPLPTLEAGRLTLTFTENRRAEDASLVAEGALVLSQWSAEASRVEERGRVVEASRDRVRVRLVPAVTRGFLRLRSQP